MKSYKPTLRNPLGYIFVFLLLSVWTNMKSQQRYYHVNEDFSSFPNTVNPFPFSGWSNTIVAGNFASDFWRFSNPGGRNIVAPASGQVAIFDSDNYSNNSQAEDVSLVLPILDTRGFDSVWVKFDQQFQAGLFGNWALEAFNGSTWAVVGSGSTQTGWQTDSVDITQYCANRINARFRFRWRGNSSYWWMLDNIQVYSPVRANNVTAVNAVLLGGQCGNSSDNIAVTVRNVSSGSLTNIPVKATVTGTIGGNPVSTIVSATVAGPLASGQLTQINLGPVNTLLGGTLDYKTYTDLSGDPDQTNDTFNVVGYSIFGTPPLPVAPDVSRCGAGTVTLDGGILSGNTGYWYTSPSATNPFSSSNTITTGVLIPPATQTYYVSQARTSSPRTLSNGFAGNVWWGATQPCGNQFTISTLSNLVIDSIGVHVPNINTTDISVYYKTGSYIGFELNSGAWTLYDKVTVRGRGNGNPTYVNIADLNLAAGQTYSFFVLSSNEMMFSSGSSTISNADLTMTCGNTIYATFSATQNDFTWNGTIYYRIFCESNKVAVNAIAKPAPSFSELSQGTPFKGSYKDGSLLAPDIVASPDNIVYNIVAPLGFFDKDHGPLGTWQVTNIDFRTLIGTTVPTADYVYTAPSISGSGKVSYTPSSAYTDSTVRLRITIKRNDNQCDTVIERVIYVAPRPDPQFTITNSCEGDLTTITNTSTILKGMLSYFWNFGDSSTSSLANPSKKYAKHGTYTVKLIVTSDLGYKDSLSKTIDVFQIPTTDFTFTNACEGAPVSMADNSTLPTGTPSYDWNYGTTPPTTGAGATTSKQYNTAGVYNVTLKVTVNGCSSSASKYVTQAPRVAPDFNFTATQCDNGEVDFTNTTPDPAFGAVNYLWKFGDGAQSTLNVVAHTYNNFNVYNVVLVGNTSLGCIDSVTKQVTLRQSPAAGFTNTSAQCTNEAITFTNSSTVPTASSNHYEWDFGDGSTSIDQDPIHQYAAPGDYTVKLTSFSTNGCESKTDALLTINLKPNAAFEATDVCKGNAVDFKNGSYVSDKSALTYAWDFGNGNTSIQDNPTVTYANAGLYNVSLTASHANGCNDIVTKTVNVFELPVVNIMAASRQTGDRAMLFTTNTIGTGYTYLWLFGDGGKSYDQNPTYLYSGDGLMRVTLQITTAEGCVGKGATTVSINSLGINTTNGINNLVNVYPNPSAGKFVIDFTQANANNIISINATDILGRVITNQVTINNAGIAEIDLSNQAAGIYYLNILTSTGTHTVKLNVSR